LCQQVLAGNKLLIFLASIQTNPEIMRRLCRAGLLLLIAATVSFPIFGQQNFFTRTIDRTLALNAGKRVIIPETYLSFSLDKSAMAAFLRGVPVATGLLQRSATPVIEIPMPDGSMSKFHIWETPVMAPGLAAKFPSIKTYSGQGIDDPAATIKIDLTELGFHAMVLSDSKGSVFIDPFQQLNTTDYIVYYKKDLKQKDPFIEQGVIPSRHPSRPTAARPPAGPCMGAELRTYRLAVACTGEYARAATGLTNPTVSQTLAAIVTTVNRVDGIYEKELAISFELVANNNLVVYTNPGTDHFTANNDGEALLDESQSVIDANIGSENYDIGHTFSTGGGGIAELESVCTSTKARGVTGLAQPVGDPYDIDYVAHEIGHQFGASHTFNATTSSCSGNRSSDTAVEPGGGITIMAYAGICGSTNDLAQNSIPYFHGVSMDEINVFVSSGSGANCAVKTPTGNSPPVVNAGGSYTIPKSTYFVLTGSATDPDNDALTYSWEQIDTGPAGNITSPSGNAPLFRSFTPVTEPVRYFPQLTDQVRNQATPGERLPSYGRDLTFRLTARDNRAGGGGACYDESSLVVDNNSGPFLITYPSAAGISWQAGSTQTITWDVANTNNAPVSCANVRIQLSIDSGYTYPITIIASTPNDGSEEIIVPNSISQRARIRVMSVGNVFYDISNNVFAITASTNGFNFGVTAAKEVACGDINAPSASITLVTESVLGYNTPIELSASGNPAGTSVSISPASVIPGQNAVITLNNVGTLKSGTYTVSVTGVSGTISRTIELSFVVLAGTGPQITAQPKPVQVCQNATAVFSVIAPGTTRYQWQVKGNGAAAFTSIEGATSATYTINTTTVGQNNSEYRVLLTGQCNVTVSNPALLTVHALPTITLGSSRVSITPGAVAKLTAIPVGSGGTLTLTWLKNETPIPVSGNELDVDISGLGSYKVRVTETWPDGNVCVNESNVVNISGAPSTSLYIYPSPNNGRFSVSYYNSGGGTTRQTVIVYDARGARVFQKTFSFSGPYQLHDIDLRGKARGVYFVVIGDAEGRKITDGKVMIY
jgi:hypothetical protein